MAIAGGARPSARLTVVNNVVVVDGFQMRHVSVLSSLHDKTVTEDGEKIFIESAVTKLLRGEQAYVQSYSSNIQDVKSAVEEQLALKVETVNNAIK
jgi:hypothetical protein